MPHRPVATKLIKSLAFVQSVVVQTRSFEQVSTNTLQVLQSSSVFLQDDSELCIFLHCEMKTHCIAIDKSCQTARPERATVLNSKI